MVGLVLNFGDIKNLKRKRESDFPDARKNFRAIFLSVGFDGLIPPFFYVRMDEKKKNLWTKTN
jgi:hypothetical protein